MMTMMMCPPVHKVMIEVIDELNQEKENLDMKTRACPHLPPIKDTKNDWHTISRSPLCDILE